ncbi:ISL3 family transposase [Chitinispirillales bacterium ANBcel5]|uniref:ISL3 family transposase n=1 Tax=Cellulosispirillum alkaliphilum TaxID=3039283 RepID=UPI002A4EEFF5|nr:ISL3 family transposase [Chitinispirillales bacterium ANBcel5]
MNDKTLFEKILGLNEPWFITTVKVDEQQQRVDIWVDHEMNIEVRCPVCDHFCAVYDHSPERVYRHLNVCQMTTFIHVRLPRSNCKEHGIKQIVSEFGENGSDMTYQFEAFIIDISKECSVKAVAQLFSLSWDRCWNAVERAVARGKARKPRVIPERIGVDEKAFARGHKYETIVTNIDKGTVEYVCDDREQKSLEAYYLQFTEKELAEVKAIAMDMWRPYMAATKKCIPGAEKKIVFDRFHAMQYVNKAVDKTRKSEHKKLMAEGDQTLKRTKYLWLWNEENVPEWRKEEYRALKAMDLKTARACAIKDNLRHLWDYKYEANMRKYFDSWYFWATHSRIKPIKDAAKTLKTHIDNIVTYAKHRITNALGESINAKVEKVKRMASGFRSRTNYITAIFYHCGGLDMYPYPPPAPCLRYRMS